MPDAKPVDGPKIRHGTIPDQEAKRQVPAHPPRELPAAVHALRGRVEPEFQEQPGIVRVLAEHGVSLLHRRELHLFHGVADEKHRIAWVERILDERRQQLPLPLRVRLPPPHLRHARSLQPAESWVTLLGARLEMESPRAPRARPSEASGALDSRWNLRARRARG